MKDIEVNGAHITDESAEILTQWQTKTEPVSACYIEVIEDLIDFLIEKGDESTPTNEVLRRIQLLRMMKKTSKSCLILNINNLAYRLKRQPLGLSPRLGLFVPGWFPALFYVLFVGFRSSHLCSITNDSNYENRNGQMEAFRD